MACEFCEIESIEKELIVAESRHSVAFMCIEPLVEGHLLAVPRRHVRELGELDRDELHDFVQLLGRADGMLRKAYDTTTSFSYMKNGAAKTQEHVHVHLMPGYVPIRESLAAYGFSAKARDRKIAKELVPVAKKIRSSGRI